MEGIAASRGIELADLHMTIVQMALRQLKENVYGSVLPEPAKLRVQ